MWLTSIKRKIVSGLLAGLAAACLVSEATQAQQVGTAAAVNPAAQARGSGGSRTIVLGQSIAHRERIQTTSAGSVQLLFLDKTSMTIGPNSDLAIDEYVYDPASNTGKLAATLTKGVMRFVGGQISHAGNAQVTTPNAVVGIRGGVGIFNPSSVYIGYGEGTVRSGGSTITLEAGDYTQTLGGRPPTTPTSPPAGFLQSMLSQLQSMPGQGGGSRTTAGQVNQARTVATGSPSGNISTAVANGTTQQITTNTTTNTNKLSDINQTIQTTTNQNRVETPSTNTAPPENLIGFTAGFHSHENQQLSFSDMLFGGALFSTDPSRNRAQANFFFGDGMAQFGSLDPNEPASSTTINGFDNVVGTETALLPAVDSNGRPKSTLVGDQIAQQSGFLVQFKPGSALTSSAQTVLGGTPFCDCEFTRWGFWRADFRRSGHTLRETIDAFWVAGRMPDVTEVPTTGIATYVGHAAAQIRNGSIDYAASGRFQNDVNFGSRTGTVTITNLDHSNYTGQVQFSSDPRFFGGFALTNDQGRAMILAGTLFRGRTSPVGEMGGMLAITSSNGNYFGNGVFLGRMR